MSLFKRKQLPGLTGVALQPEGVCVVRVERNGAQPPALTLADFRPWAEADGEAKLLARLAADHDLKRSRVATVLDQKDYSLLVTEAPDVPADELRAALRWRIKDLIDFHINDATLDVFDLPGERPTGRARSMYAVAARSQAIQRIADLMQAAGVNLQIIDIAELAQRNVAALLPEDAAGVMLLSLNPGGGLITITRQGDLYLSRSIDVGIEALARASDPTGYFERIALEVQRSLDYYDSHFRQAPIGHLALAPLPEPIPGLVEHLAANLNVAVSPMDLMKLLRCERELSPVLQSVCLPAIGAALRYEERAL